jgi:hypothetical protein
VFLSSPTPTSTMTPTSNPNPTSIPSPTSNLTPTLNPSDARITYLEERVNDLEAHLFQTMEKLSEYISLTTNITKTMELQDQSYREMAAKIFPRGSWSPMSTASALPSGTGIVALDSQHVGAIPELPATQQVSQPIEATISASASASRILTGTVVPIDDRMDKEIVRFQLLPA